MNKLSYQDFEQIYREYDPIITYKTIKEIGKITPDWEDVRAEVYLSLVKVLSNSSFRGDCKIGTFIFVIVQRRVIDFIRKKYKMKRIEESLISNYQEKTSSNPEDIFIKKEM